MDAHMFLSQVKTLKERIDQKMIEIEELRTLMDAVKSLQYDGQPDSQRGYIKGASFEALVAKNLALEEQIIEEVDQLNQLKHDIIQMVQDMSDPKLSQLLFKRYIQFKPLELVAFEMGYSYGYIRQLQMHALAEFFLGHKWEILKYKRGQKSTNKN